MIPPSQFCQDFAGTPISIKYPLGSTPSCFSECEIAQNGGVTLCDGTNTCYGDFSYTGNECPGSTNNTNTTTNPTTTNTSSSSSTSPTGTTNTSSTTTTGTSGNGTQTSTTNTSSNTTNNNGSSSSTNTNSTTSTGPDGTQTTTTTSSTTTCDDQGNCTTTTTGSSQSGEGYQDEDGNSVTGGGECSQAPICDGDAVSCSILKQQWLLRCETAPQGEGLPTASGTFDSQGVEDALTQAQDDFNDTIDQIKAEAESMFNLSVSSGSGTLPDANIDTQWGLLNIGLSRFASQLTVIGSIVIAVCAIIAALIILRD